MRVAIISDIHDNLINLKKCLSWCRSNSIASIFCCGDVTNQDTLEILANNFEKSIYLVQGNVELYETSVLQKFSNIEYFGKIANFVFEKYDIGMCHQPYLIDKVLDRKSDIVFYGHTHKPWIEEREGVNIVNPGPLGGMFELATFAVWDTEKGSIDLKRVEDI